ncbi:unnamed protein product [Linum tenue]|uniref:Uncharacterized protein n=1 Tax=Linum tenue TaxID=586396 RepID=A0AAV0L526_9ROSI|nr:unnamed protein product [Linum tenue]
MIMIMIIPTRNLTLHLTAIVVVSHNHLLLLQFPNLLLRLLLPHEMHPHIGIQEQKHNRGVQYRIEHPSSDPIAPSLHEMKQQNSDVADQIPSEQSNLAIEHKGEAGAGQPDCGPEPVPVNRRINHGGEHDSEDLETLREFEPEEGNDGEDDVVEELAEDEAAGGEDGEEGAEHVDESGEVVHVRPEEDPTRGPGSDGETEEPLKRGL